MNIIKYRPPRIALVFLLVAWAATVLTPDLGVTMMLAGMAGAVGTTPFYAAAIACFLVIQVAFCPFEEAKLETQFGVEYLAYKARVGRWLFRSGHAGVENPFEQEKFR